MKKQLSYLVGISLFVWLISSVSAYTVDELDGANFLGQNGYIVNNASNPTNYRLSDTITRREVMKIMANTSKSTIPTTCSGVFSDVKSNDWGCRYIEWGVNAKIIAKNTSFRPNDSISKSEALKMILNVNKVTKTSDTGNWQDDYVQTAYDKGWYEENWSDYTTPATRGWIFMSVNRVMNNIKVSQTDNSDDVLNQLLDLLK